MDLRRFVFAALVLGVMIGALVAAGPVAAQGDQSGTVTAAALNVRTGPGIGYERVGLLYRGDRVTILESRDGWYRVSFDTGEGWVASGYVQRGQPAAETAQTPAGPTTDRLVFQRASGGPIYTVNLDGSDLRQVGAGIDPSWSPDGTRIVYVSWTEPRGIYVMNADGSNKRRLFDASEPRSPRWSPDGKTIVFANRLEALPERENCVVFRIPGVFSRRFCFDVPPDEASFLGIVDVASGQFNDLPSWPHSKTPSWYPDSEHIVYESEKGLHKIDRGGMLGFDPNLPQINAVTLDTSDSDPELSPDGRYLVTTYRQHDHWEIHRVDLQTGARLRLTESPFLADPPANNVAPTWSPDGSQILFLSDRGGSWGFYLMNADGSNQRQILQEVTASVPLSYEFAAEQVVDWIR